MNNLLKIFGFRKNKPHAEQPDWTEDAIAHRLSAEAKKWNVSTPSGLQMQVMTAVTRAIDLPEKRDTRVWPVGFAIITITTCFAIGLIVIIGPFRSSNPTNTVEAGPQSERVAFDLVGYLNSAETAETFATQSFLAEYENLSRDARLASDFVWSTTTQWISLE